MTTVAQSKNILIIGKTGAGKASIANAIVGKELFQVETPMLICQDGTGFRIKEYEGYNVALVDTHVNLQTNISKALTKLTYLNLVLFVLKCEPVDEHLQTSFKKAESCLGQKASTITAVIVTWCDLKNAEAKEKDLEELQKYLAQLFSFAVNRVEMVSLPLLEDVPKDILPYFQKEKQKNEEILKKMCLEEGIEIHCQTGKCIYVAIINCRNYYYADTLKETPRIEPPPTAMAMSPTQPPKTRKILIFGKAGAGKSTVANAIIGVDVFEVAGSIQSTTRKAIMRYEEGKGSDGFTYKVALVDTVGVGDSRPPKSLQERAMSGSKKLKAVNLILFVFKLERFTQQEKESFQAVMKFLGSSPNASAVTALIVTCCEQKDEQAREQIKHELKQSTKVAQFSQKGIFLVGLPPLNQLPPPIKEHYEQIIIEDTTKLQILTKKSHQEETINPGDSQVYTNIF